MDSGLLERKLAALSSHHGDITDFAHGADETLRRAIGYDIAIWGAIDPLTLMFTHCVPVWSGDGGGDDGGFDAAREMRLFELEFHTEEPNVYPLLAGQTSPVGALRQLVPHPAGKVRRYDELLAPFGIFDELRLVLRDGTTSWGVVTMYRMEGRPAFDRDSLALAAPASSVLARGYRNSLLRAALDSPFLVEPPGLLSISADGDLVATSAAAEALLDGLAQDQVRVVLRQLQAAVAGDGNVSATTVGDAGPVSFQLTSMKGTDGGFGVIVERPRPNQLAELIMRALQLTDRERTITGWVAAGRTTGQVAAAARDLPAHGERSSQGNLSQGKRGYPQRADRTLVLGVLLAPATNRNRPEPLRLLPHQR